MDKDHIDNFYRDLGVRLMNARLERGLSVSHVSRTLGMDATDYADVEMGTRHIQVHTLRAIATALNIGVGALFGSKDECGKPANPIVKLKFFLLKSWRQKAWRRLAS